MEEAGFKAVIGAPFSEDDLIVFSLEDLGVNDR
jgi:hypothetical protein